MLLSSPNRILFGYRYVKFGVPLVMTARIPKIERTASGQFQKGVSDNPAGRPKGARAVYQAALGAVLAGEWDAGRGAQSGAAAARPADGAESRQVMTDTGEFLVGTGVRLVFSLYPEVSKTPRRRCSMSAHGPPRAGTADRPCASPDSFALPILALAIARSGLLPEFPRDGLIWQAMPLSIGLSAFVIIEGAIFVLAALEGRLLGKGGPA
jgi:hypothetical protein